MYVMVNGLPGNMAANAAKHIIRQKDEFNFIPVSFTGPEIAEKECIVEHVPIELVRPEGREAKIDELKALHDIIVAVDYTADKKNPNLPREQVEFYCSHNIPFVMGATGGKRDSPEPGADNSGTLQQRVRDSDITAVIAPNMGRQIVALQAFMEGYAREHAGKFEGYELVIIESHQKRKADTSGTAKAMAGYFNQLGIDFKIEDIEKIRDPELQRELGIPEEYLDAHGWHTYEIEAQGSNTPLRLFKKAVSIFLAEDKAFADYSLNRYSGGLERISPDRTVVFQVNLEDNNRNLSMSHNVNGRDIYGLGNLGAVRFEIRKVQAGEKGIAYSMIDVMREG
jgi:4-hydroxy-tetrahydrodipicolinate reductase